MVFASPYRFGSGYLPVRELVAEGVKILGVPQEVVAEQVPDLAVEEPAVCDKVPGDDGVTEAVYLPPFFHSERSVASSLTRGTTGWRCSSPLTGTGCSGTGRQGHPCRAYRPGGEAPGGADRPRGRDDPPVSYTHLTLPTIYSV